MSAPTRSVALALSIAWLALAGAVRADVPDAISAAEDVGAIEATALDAAVERGPDASDDASDAHDAGSPDAVDSGDAAVDSGDAAAVDSADAAVDSADAAVDSGDVAVDSGDAAVDSGDAAVDSGDAAVDSGDAAVDTGDAAGVSPKPPHPAPHHGATTTPSMSSAEAIRAIFGLVLLLALAYIGGHPAVQRLEVKLRISQVITAGFPFVIIGLVSRETGLGILTDPVLDSIRPILTIGLGWIGFAVGFRFEVRKLDTMPPLTNEAFIASSAVPYVFIVIVTGVLLLAINEAESGTSVIRDAFIVATAGAMTATSLPRLLERNGAAPADVERVSRIIQLEEIAALTGILVLGAFFRTEQADGWQLPSVGWVFVTFGLGTALAGITFALLGTVKTSSEILIATLGMICFAGGMASYLRLSPVVVCFIAGAVLQNFAGAWKSDVASALSRVERPVYLIFLVIAGALWRVDEWQGWVLMVAFVAARLLGRVGGVWVFGYRHPRVLTRRERRHIAISPMGALALAIVVTAQDLYSGPTVPWMVNAVIGGAFLTEIIVQIFGFERAKPRPGTMSMPAFVIEHAPAARDDDADGGAPR